MKTNRVNESSSFINPNRNFHRPLIELEKRIFQRFNTVHSNSKNIYHIKIINEIICNEKTHIVAEFKDYLIHGDMTEFMQEYHHRCYSMRNLPKILEYYESCSVIFPNYSVLPESKYIYKNIKKKQRLINYQQRLEHEFEMKKEKNNSILNDEDSDKVFDTKVIDSLLNQTNTSAVNQIFGAYSEKNKNDISNKSINEMIETLTKVNLNQQPFTCRYKSSYLKKDTADTRYANCTTTTKDKSSIGPQKPVKKKMRISNVYFNERDILIKALKDLGRCKPSRPLSNDNSNNASQYKDNTKHISSSSSKNPLISQKECKGITLHAKNNLSSSKISYLYQNPSQTSRENKINTEMIQILSSKLLKIKSPKQKVSISQFREHQQKSKKTISSLSTGTSSITQKVSHVQYQGNDKVYDNLYDKYDKSPVVKKGNNVISNRNRKEFEYNNKTNAIKNNNIPTHLFSLSPTKQNDLIARTCAQLPSNNCFNKNKSKKAMNAVIPRKEPLMKGIQIKGFNDILKENNSRNFNSISDRFSNKNKSSAHKMIY